MERGESPGLMIPCSYAHTAAVQAIPRRGYGPPVGGDDGPVACWRRRNGWDKVLLEAGTSLARGEHLNPRAGDDVVAYAARMAVAKPDRFPLGDGVEVSEALLVGLEGWTRGNPRIVPPRDSYCLRVRLPGLGCRVDRCLASIVSDSMWSIAAPSAASSACVSRCACVSRYPPCVAASNE